MDSRKTGKLLRYLRHVLQSEGARGGDDAELLARFATARDEAAFAALVRKHGRLVWRVCRRVLDHDQDAEDAFQGTFLVLARKPNSIRKHGSLASWLYGVAYRVAHKAKVAAARRRKHENRAVAAAKSAETAYRSTQSEIAWRELQAMLDEELNRLPEKYRAPFVLCCLESRSKREVAEELGWKAGTVSSRLATARRILHQRLARRGVMLSVLLSGTAIAENTAAAAPFVIAASSIKAGLAFAAGHSGSVSPTAVQLAEALLQSMAAVKLKIGVVLLLVTVAVTSAWVLRPQASDAEAAIRNPETEHRAELRRPAAAAVSNVIKRANRDAEAQLTVSGRVLGSDKRPLGGAKVAVLASTFRRPGERGPETGKWILKSGATDARGEFHLRLERPSIERNYNMRLIVAGPDHAPRWYKLPTDGASLDCELESGRVVRGRLVDDRGRPATGVRVQVLGLATYGTGASNVRFDDLPHGLEAWLAPAMTDQTGSFAFAHAAGNCELDLQVSDDRFSPQWFRLEPDQQGRDAPITFTLQPRRTLSGRVRCADTGEAMAGAHLQVVSVGPGAGSRLGTTEVQTDEQGRFSVAPFPGAELNVTVYPAQNAPYRVMQHSLRWLAGTRYKTDFRVPRGVLVRGRIIEKPSGMPVAYAAIEYEPRAQDNLHARHDNSVFSSWWLQDACSGKDGGFQLIVPPGPGWLLVTSPSPDHVHVDVSARQLECGKRGGNHYFPDALAPLNLKLGVEPAELICAVRRGVKVGGPVLAHDGSPTTSAFVLTPTYIPQRSARRAGSLPMRLPVRDGRFELPGCDPERSVPVFYFDIASDQAAVVEVFGQER